MSWKRPVSGTILRIAVTAVKNAFFKKYEGKPESLGTDVILEGTNEDDLHVYRPGIRALGELGILSPLAQAGLTKAEVRRLAGEYGLSAANRPAAPCLGYPFSPMEPACLMRRWRKSTRRRNTFGDLVFIMCGYGFMETRPD